MLLHTVFFWLKDGLLENDKEIFLQEVTRLGEINSVENFYLGSPANTPKRDVIEDTYDFAITVFLKDMIAHDQYQVDPIHLDFIEKCKGYWEKVVIYDAD
jgi:hypothetical protein